MTRRRSPDKILEPLPSSPSRRSGFSTALFGCLGLVLAAGVVLAAQEVWRAASHADEKLVLQGVGNFGRMNPRLYRGAQPTDAGFAALRATGIDTVVRFSLGEEGSTAEKRVVEALGMRFVNLPWSTVHEPTSEQVVTFLRLLRDHPDYTVFVHCKAGSDRTGVMIALSRIALDRLTVGEALDEMKAFHYRYIFLPHLQKFVEAFPARLASEPGLLAGI